VLTAEAGLDAVERLAEVVPEQTLASAREAAEVSILALDAPPAAALSLVAPLRAAGAFVHVDATRLLLVTRRGALEVCLTGRAGEERAVLEELLRAFDADRTRPARMRMRGHVLDFTSGAKVMGILNVTPDSFYDRGRYAGVERARERAAEMVALGAGIIDIGGQSYAHWNPQVAAREERERVVPVVEALVGDGLGVPLSIDTYKAEVAEAALAAGADAINDCSGLSDSALAGVVARYDAALVVMHLKGELNVRAESYEYADAMGEIGAFLRERTERALAAGVARDSIAIDPGLEFGKEPATDLEILERFGDLRSLGFPILFAASRKSFIGRVFDRPARELLVPSLATAAIGIEAGAAMLRVHDVAETAQLIKMLAAIRSGVRQGLRVAEKMPETPA
jgi:dihydropteroate synthase